MGTKKFCVDLIRILSGFAGLAPCRRRIDARMGCTYVETPMSSFVCQVCYNPNKKEVTTKKEQHGSLQVMAGIWLASLLCEKFTSRPLALERGLSSPCGPSAIVAPFFQDLLALDNGSTRSSFSYMLEVSHKANAFWTPKVPNRIAQDIYIK